ncbi:Phosphate uptake regulator [Archaeoglobus sulfaticallidus PM70-1]|uniref:Phosphate uptake regulator n=1 Tax=Archaeoglobus sulfaticallidus PM70-1 TaxID=387631 RepID=N0BI50_9EURY|nr:phosphate uptake regulator PhoU [Archaeoglobus sulfaticallidus]AGK61967.1 Phosphate uptake regulator [Archaeoglobus sulfaticallidus PM70-1]
MNVRRLQFIGGSSYMVSLPKNWIRSNDLEQGDELVLNVEDECIIILPKKISESSKVVKGQIKGLKQYDTDFLRRFIYAVYIQGLDEIVIEDKNINPRILTKISDVVRTMIGMEIIHAKDGKIVLRCMNTPDFDFSGVLKRMYQIIDAMIDGIIDGLKVKDATTLNEIKYFESDLDRLYFLALREQHRKVKELSITVKWNELRMILGARTVTKLIEEIADSLREFSDYVKNIEDKEEVLIKLLTDVKTIFSEVLKAYSESDLTTSEKVIKETEKLIVEIVRLISENQEINYRMSLETLKEIMKNIKSIGEVAFNRSVRDLMTLETG